MGKALFKWSFLVMWEGHLVCNTIVSRWCRRTIPWTSWDMEVRRTVVVGVCFKYFLSKHESGTCINSSSSDLVAALCRDIDGGYME